MVLEEEFQRFLAEGHGAAGEDWVCAFSIATKSVFFFGWDGSGEGVERVGGTLHAVHVLLKRLLLERLHGRVLDAVDSHAELQVLEGRVLADVGEGFGEVLGFGVGGEGLDRGAWGGRAEGFGEVAEVVWVAREEGEGVVAVRGVGEDACYAGALDG